MYLDYSKLEFDSFGRPEVPELKLQTLSGKTIGVIPYTSQLKFNIKFAELSEMSFEVPRNVDGGVNPLYDSVTGYKLLYTDHYGVYVIMSPTVENDGVTDIKQVTCYSREKLLDTKRFFLAEGTYNFWNPASPNDTLLGMVLEGAIGWHIGYVSPSLIGRYRTFEEYDDNLLSFVYNSAPEKYRCVFVFNPYAMSINVYDADEERPALPIYLDFDNLVQNIKVEEMSEELVTALRPYGADSLDIRSVNPIGSNWLYDLSYFISNGSIDEELAERWNTWQQAIEENRTAYNGLVGLQASTTAALLAEKAKLTDLDGELTDLTNQQSITIQAQALESTSDGIAYQQSLLDDINAKISAKKTEIAEQESAIAVLDGRLDAGDDNSYTAQINNIVSTLSFNNYFTEEEQTVLGMYFIEQDLTESTFVATNLNTSVSGATYKLDGGAIAIASSDVVAVEVDLTDGSTKTMYTLVGGTFSVSGTVALSGDIIRGTIETAADGTCVASVYAGAILAGETKTSGGMVTVSGTYSSLSSDVTEVNENEVTALEGSAVTLNMTTGSLYLTADVSDFQKYSVQLELLDFATKTLADVATPTYEFSVDSGNFIFAKEFAPFKEKMELGKGIYLRVSHDQVITPIAIEMELDFEDREEFSLIFSNRFKRHDNVNTLKDMLEKSYSSSRTIDANKYIYNKATDVIPSVTQFMQDSLDAAVNNIVAAANQTVLMNGAGIQVGGDSRYKMRIIDNMIAMTDDDWQTAKLAIGRFCSDEVGEYWGVNAEVIGGKLLVGNNLIIENAQVDENGNSTGVMTFRVDASGAWLYNSTFVLDSAGVDENGNEITEGKLLLSPEYGFVAGNGNLFTTNGTAVVPSFIDPDTGELIVDDDGMPINTNLYLDSRDGSAYFRGTINAAAGEIGGWTIAEDFLHSGSNKTYVALNASGDNEYSAYAIWAGAENPANAPFWVKKNGDFYAGSGTFKGDGKFTGTVQASDFLDANGNSMLTDDDKFKSDYLEIKGLNVNDRFIVDENGQVTIVDGSITFSSLTDTDELYEYIDNAASEGGAEALAAANQAQQDALAASELAQSAVLDSQTVADTVAKLANGEYENGTFINENSVQSPEIIGGNIYGSNFYAGEGSYTFAQMTESGFYVYHNQTEPNIDSTVDPKVSLNCNYSGSNIALILGAGNSATNNYSNRFFLQKGTDSTGIYYYDALGTLCGFTLDSKGKITVHGEIEGLSPVAVFGE